MHTVTAHISRRCRPIVASAVLVPALALVSQASTASGYAATGAQLNQTRVVAKHSKVRGPNPRTNLAAYLAAHAGRLPPPLPARPAGFERVTTRMRDRNVREPLRRQSLAEMRHIWSVAGRYFPGRGMPEPGGHPVGGEALGAVAFARNPEGEPVPVGVQLGPDLLRQLVRPRDAYERDDALRVLLHEWAHNYQRPALYASARRKGVDPILEAGAEGFAFAAAPGIARALGRPYARQQSVGFSNEYRPWVMNAVRKRGMTWLMRGQFAP